MLTCMHLKLNLDTPINFLTKLEMDNQISQQPIKIVIDATLITNEKETPELVSESLKGSPNILIFILTKLHAGYFEICVSLGAQALLWKTLSKQAHKLHVYHRLFHILPSTAFLLLWWLALGTLTLLTLLYILRCIFKFKLVISKLSDPVGMNYLFSPWISWLLLLSSAPFSIPATLNYQLIWCVFVAPVVILDLKVYGQWFTTEKRFLSMFANPTSQMSVIANLLGAWVAAEIGWRESALCIFTLGAAHYLVVFITLYQQLSGARRLPARMGPVYFLFVAAPSMGSLAWNSMNGGFDIPCKMLFFLSLFLFASLACRPAFFKKSMKRFTVAWWAYSFPITFLALAATEYSNQVKVLTATGLSLALSVLSILIFLSLLVYSVLNIDMVFRGDGPSYLATKAKIKTAGK